MLRVGVVDPERRELDVGHRIRDHGDLARQPLLEGLPLLALRAGERVGLAQVLARDGGEDELAGDTARGRVELDGLRVLADVDDRLVREHLPVLAAVRREDHERGDQPGEEDRARPAVDNPARPLGEAVCPLDIGASRGHFVTE